ncbi:MAG: hypothetical protein LBD48_05080 [Treponema sp.]|nr:hypothetical protein [Treponema sp.]
MNRKKLFCGSAAAIAALALGLNLSGCPSADVEPAVKPAASLVLTFSPGSDDGKISYSWTAVSFAGGGG